MKIAIRTDASTHIGSGHVMRCINLAKLLKQSGHEVVFVCRPQSGDLINFIKLQDISIICLDTLDSCRRPNHSADYIGWLQTSVDVDANEFLSKIQNIDLVITDHYAIGEEWQSLVRTKLKCKIIAIDDLVRDHDADLIIDQTYGRDCSDYKANIKVLAGSKYALIGPDFALMRNQAISRVLPAVSRVRVLLSMGGVDNPNVTLKILQALSKRDTILNTSVVLNKNAPHFDLVSSFCKKNETWIKHILFSDNMARLMLQNTIAIGAPGVTSWERACMGLPSIIIPLAENQLQISKNLVHAGCALSLSKENIEYNLNSKVDELLSNYEDMKKNNLKICDGMGVERVVREINQLGGM